VKTDQVEQGITQSHSSTARVSLRRGNRCSEDPAGAYSGRL